MFQIFSIPVKSPKIKSLSWITKKIRRVFRLTSYCRGNEFDPTFGRKYNVVAHNL